MCEGKKKRPITNFGIHRLFRSREGKRRKTGKVDMMCRQDAEVRIQRCCLHLLLQYYCRLEFCLKKFFKPQ